GRCLACGAEIPRPRPTQRACSPRCRWALWKGVRDQRDPRLLEIARELVRLLEKSIPTGLDSPGSSPMSRIVPHRGWVNGNGASLGLASPTIIGMVAERRLHSIVALSRGVGGLALPAMRHDES